MLLLALVLPVLADSAATFYSKGQDAESRQDWEAAYTFYQKAWQLKPKNTAYRSALARTRFQAGAQSVHAGQLLRDQGKLAEALGMFERAAAIDPGSPIAQQEIRRTRVMIDAARSSAAGEGAIQPQSFQKRLEGSSGVVELKAVGDVPISLKVADDSKIVYESIGAIAGINVLFDPDYTSRRIRIELNGVTLGEALQMVALESKTFWRTVTPNTIFVAADTPAKRKELEQNLVKTFYLANLSQPTELQDVVNTLRTILEVSRLTQVPSQGAIVVRGTPDQIALAEKLIDDLDKARPEVIVDVVVMSVSREKMRNLGITLPQSASIALQPNVNTTTTTTTTNGTTTPTTTTPTNNAITLNNFATLNSTDFQVTISPATANFLYNDNDSKLVQNPQIRALDGQKASLKIGQRVPVATGSFGAGVGGVGVTNSLVNTQFQYLDVGVNIDITPRIHAGREVTLKLALEISEVDSTTNIGGISQPVIGQRKIEHEIRLRDGESNLLGGLMEDTDTKSWSGWPWLSQIPILKYLFGSDSTDRLKSELVFVLTPHIVRGQELSRLNVQPVDVGTGNQIQLRRPFGDNTTPKPASEAGQPTPGSSNSGPANGAPANSPTGAAPGAQVRPPGVPGTMAPGAANVPRAGAVPGALNTATAGQNVVLNFVPATVETTKGSTFMLDVSVNGAQNLFSAPVQIQYDPTRLQVVNVSNGDFLGRDQQAVALAQRDDPATGTIQLTANRPPKSGGVSGQGTVFTLTFLAKENGTARVAIGRAGLKDAANVDISASGSQAVVNIKDLEVKAESKH